MIEQFKNAMRNHGIEPPEYIVADGQIHRVKKSVWYVFHDDWGVFGDWKYDIKQSWHPEKGYKTPSPEDRKQRQDQSDRLKELEKTKQDEAMRRAQNIYSESYPASPNHPYLIKKGILPLVAKQANGRLIIPIQDINSQLVNLQFISNDGEKRFLKGGLKKGCFCSLGEFSTETFLICEGFATGASLQREFNRRTIVAFDAGNLLPVAQNIRQIHPDAKIIICADNDVSGVGQKAAFKASAAVHAQVLIPYTPGNDWNDELISEI